VKAKTKPGRSLTSRDLARILGVSQSMVSRAFSPDASIADDMRARIMETAEALGYRPNVVARSLATQSSRIVGVIMGMTDNPFYGVVLDRLSSKLQKAGYQPLLFSVPVGEEVDAQLPFLRQHNIGTVIVASATISSGIANEWAKTGRKAILFNRTVPETSVASVSCDNVGGARAIADHLAELGRRRLGFVAGRRDTSTNLDRERGFLARLAELGIGLMGRAEGGDYTFAAGHAAALALAPLRPDAIFFANDVMALGGIDAIRYRLGLRIPEDIAVVGFDDIPMSAWPSYDLTTLRQPIDRMIDETVSLVSQETAWAAEAPAHIVLAGELIARGSTIARHARTRLSAPSE
jgi:DNA-binding LacI/PurR family transcriptional regulator